MKKKVVLEFKAKEGVVVGFITNRVKAGTKYAKRLRGLGLDFYEKGSLNTMQKAEAMKKIAERFGVDPSKCAYIGNTESDKDNTEHAGWIWVDARDVQRFWEEEVKEVK